MNYDVVCVGNLVADIITSPLSRLPASGELVQVEELLLQTGGCAANTAVGLARLGARVAVVGKVGDDVFGEFICCDLQNKGVEVSGIRHSSKAPTSRTVILPVLGEDRRFLHSIGANAELGLDDVDLALVASAKVLYVGGYLLLPRLDSTSLTNLFQFACSRGITTVLDVAGARPEEGIMPLKDVLPYTDVFLPNDDEARSITGENDPGRQAEVFVGFGVGTAIVTIGGHGIVARTRESTLRANAFRIEVVDPSGAGDAFDAGFIFGLLKGWDLPKIVEFASALGASACTKLGCTSGVFSEPEAMAFIAQNRLEIATS